MILAHYKMCKIFQIKQKVVVTEKSSLENKVLHFLTFLYLILCNLSFLIELQISKRVFENEVDYQEFYLDKYLLL